MNSELILSIINSRLNVTVCDLNWNSILLLLLLQICESILQNSRSFIEYVQTNMWWPNCMNFLHATLKHHMFSCVIILHIQLHARISWKLHICLLLLVKTHEQKKVLNSHFIVYKVHFSDKNCSTKRFIVHMRR